MHWLDWSIMLGMFVVISVVAYSTKKYTQSVADFLAANRSAGKYLLGVADGIAGLGAISVVAMFEMYYKAGFNAVWWNTMTLPLGAIIAVTGWIQYRYRQTRALTMAQFMEVRYSRRFRVFAGFMCFFSGILNFGIFPAVGGRFFQHFCGLPSYWISIGFTEIDATYAGIMIVLLTISLAFTFMGGQIAVIVTDFLQGVFCNAALCLLAAYVLFVKFDWSEVLQALATAPADASLINPANTAGTENYNVTYFLVALFGAFLNFMAWQGNQGYYGCARTPHAARMGRVVGTFRYLVQITGIVLLALGAYTFLHHANYAGEAQQVRQVLGNIENETIQEQQTVTVALTHILPTGLLGIFAAVMFAAFVSTHDTYLHSWGSIFIQDVVLPVRLMLRRDDKPMSEKAHLRLLRASILGVAVFIFFFSLFFSQQQDILMFFALTGTFYLGWAGWAICGGLYWKYGNSAGAWVGAIVGLVLSVSGWFVTYNWGTTQALFERMYPSLWSWVVETYPSFAGDKCPITAQVLYFWSMVITGVAYVGTSLLFSRKAFDMDRMLHRGRYAVEQDAEGALPKRGWQALRMDKTFKWDDKILYIGSLGFTFAMFAVFLVGTLLFAVFGIEISDASWGSFWWWYTVIVLIFIATITVWLTVGGFIDLGRLFRDLGKVKRNADDDGTVVGHESLADLHARDAKKDQTTAS